MRIERAAVVFLLSSAFAVVATEGSLPSSASPGGYPAGYNYGQHQQQGGWAAYGNNQQQPNQNFIQNPQEPDRLPPLPQGWSEHFDPSSGQPYYYNSADGTTTWDRPPPESAPEEGPGLEKEDEAGAEVANVTESEQAPVENNFDRPQPTGESTQESAPQREGPESGESSLPEGRMTYAAGAEPLPDEQRKFGGALDAPRDGGENANPHELRTPLEKPSPLDESASKSDESADHRQGMGSINEGYQTPDRPQGVPDWGRPSNQVDQRQQMEPGPDQRSSQGALGTDTYGASPTNPQQPRGWVMPRADRPQDSRPGSWGRPRDDNKDSSLPLMAPWEGQPENENAPHPRSSAEGSYRPVPRQPEGWRPHQGQEGPRGNQSRPQTQRTGIQQPVQRDVPSPPGHGQPEQHGAQRPFPRDQSQQKQQQLPPRQAAPNAGQQPSVRNEPAKVAQSSSGPMQSAQNFNNPSQQNPQQPQDLRFQDQQQQAPVNYQQPFRQQQNMPPNAPPSQYRPPLQTTPGKSGQEQPNGPYGSYYGNQYGQYGQYSSPQGMPGQQLQLATQEPPSPVKEALGSAWQGILGFGNRTKGAYENAKNSVLSGAKEAGQSISSTSTNLWEQARSSIGSVFEQSTDEQQNYSLSGRYGAPPVPGNWGPPSNQHQPGYIPQPPGYNPQQPGYNPQQPGYPPQQSGYSPQQQGQPPQQPGYPYRQFQTQQPQHGGSGQQQQQGYPPRQQQPQQPQQQQQQQQDNRQQPGRFPPGYSPPQPRSDPSHPHDQQQGRQPPLQSSWGTRQPPPAGGQRPGPYGPQQPGMGPQQQRPPYPQQQQRPPNPGNKQESDDGKSTDPWNHPALGSDF